MFKLAELFVSINADQAPMQKAIASLKGSIASIGAGMGASISGVFGALVGGPIGLAMSAFSSLGDMVDMRNKDVKQLGVTWYSAIIPIEHAIRGIINQMAALANKTIEWVRQTPLVVTMFSTIKTYGQAALDNVVIAVERGIEVFRQISDSIKSAFNSAIGSVLQFYNQFAVAFGGSSISSVDNLGTAITTQIQDNLAQVGRFLRNWPNYFAIAFLTVQEKFVNMGEMIGTLPANLAIIGEYVANNWVKMITDGINAVIAAFHNLGSYLGELGYAIYEWFKDPTKGFKAPEWKGLLDGFKATADKLPDLIKPVFSDNTQKIADQWKEIANREKEISKRPPTKIPMAAKTPDFTSTTMGVAEAYVKMREKIYSQQDDSPRKIVENTMLTAKAAQETATNVKDLKLNRLGK